MAPSTTGRPLMNEMPANSDWRLTGVLTGTACSIRTSASNTCASKNSPAAVAYTTGAPATYRKPPSAGPRMTPVCPAELDSATARGNACSGTSVGNSACSVGVSNARIAPITTTHRKIGCTPACPLAARTASESATRASMA